jgi:TonB-dependent SusC/RagA subfamily outer membrane receptor
MKRRFTFIFFMFCILVFPFAVSAQDITVTGTVTDQADGKPIPGVTVKLQGTTRGTVTDGSGKFSILTPGTGARLQVSQIGMVTQTISITSPGPLNIQLSSDAQALGEVVVVGYGTQKKSVVTGAISSVKAADLESMPINRVEQALQGRTSGVNVSSSNGQPGSASTIRIRGYSTFASNGNNDPLWVVDGVIVDNGGIGYINQNDIESIEVLKDAASQAIYGARAANGVIIVSTKKGKTGLQINYNGFYGTSAPARKLDLLNASQYEMKLQQTTAKLRLIPIQKVLEQVPIGNLRFSMTMQEDKPMNSAFLEDQTKQPFIPLSDMLLRKVSLQVQFQTGTGPTCVLTRPISRQNG